MSVNFFPILVDEKVLADKIQHFRQTLPLEKIDEAIQEAWRNDELRTDKEQSRFSFREFDLFDNTRFWIEADSIRTEILYAAFLNEQSNPNETLRSADALYQFIGAFGYFRSTNNGINDYGVIGCCAISPVNIRRLHELFKNIDFELLRPVFEQSCKDKYREQRQPATTPEKKYRWIPDFEVLQKYASAFNGLIAEALAKNKAIYMWAA